ncbi:MAG: type IX secretion system protein PorQ [Saprospiraceae bacterium]|nr:type IX secretion system protein PorQ [Saprospiraceae bacterium]
MKYKVAILLILFPFFLLGQIGGKYTFHFLNLPHSARITALGSSQIATKDNDIILGLQSPSLLNPSMHKSLAVNHNFHLADIAFGNAAIGYHVEKWGLSTIVAINYLSYGDFIRTDEFANVQGEFTGGDIGFTLGAAKKWNERITTGINLKWLQSSLDVYNSSGLGVDFGVTYENPEKSTITTFVVRNIGAQFSSFSRNREAFPLDVQIGTSKRLKYLPLRLSFILHDLNNWNLRSEGLDDNDPIFIDQEDRESSFIARTIDNFFHHVIINGEFLIGENEVFRLRFGYNHQIKKELTVSTFRSLNGFSFGFGFKVKRIAFDYGFGSYHLAGGMNHISLSTNLTEWNKN